MEDKKTALWQGEWADVQGPGFGPQYLGGGGGRDRDGDGENDSCEHPSRFGNRSHLQVALSPGMFMVPLRTEILAARWSCL